MEVATVPVSDASNAADKTKRDTRTALTIAFGVLQKNKKNGCARPGFVATTSAVLVALVANAPLLTLQHRYRQPRTSARRSCANYMRQAIVSRTIAPSRTVWRSSVLPRTPTARSASGSPRAHVAMVPSAPLLMALKQSLVRQARMQKAKLVQSLHLLSCWSKAKRAQSLHLLGWALQHLR